MRFGLGLLLVSLAGCDLRDRYVASSPSVWVDGGAITGLEGVGASGAVPQTAWVRAVNGYGASVSSVDGEVTVDGVNTPIFFDGLGYANLTFDTPGVSTITAGTTPVSVFRFPNRFTPPGMAPVAYAPVAVDGLAKRVGHGSVGVSGSEVWWSDDLGHQAHRVLDAGAAIQGLKVVDADVDELSDVLVWTTERVFLLRARTGGGMAWGGALQAPGYTVGGVGVGDLSGDNIPDVAVAWARSSSSDGLVEVWHGDGLYGFERAEPRELDGLPNSLMVADSTGEGQPQITLLYADGSWVRYIEGAPGRLMPIGPATPASTAPSPGWVLTEPLDFDGDGRDEIPTSTPYNPVTNQRSMLIYDVAGGQIQALPLTDEPAPWVGVGDGDGDVFDDLWLHRTDGLVQVLHYEGEVAGLPTYPRTTVLRSSPGPGPIDIEDIDDDGENDLWVATSTLWWSTRGRGIGFDAERFWEPEEPEHTFVREEVTGAFRLVELEGADSLEIVAALKEGSSLQLGILRFHHDDERAELLGAVDLAGGDLVDLEVCGTRAFALTDTTLHAVALSPVGSPAVLAQVALTDPRDVVCGTGPGSATVSVAAGGEIVSFTNALSEVDRTVSAAYGVAYADLTGAGPTVHACVTEGCELVGWTLSTGQTGLLVVDPQEASFVDATGTVLPLKGVGDFLLFADLDGDAVQEVLSHDAASGVVSVFREVGGRPAPATSWQSASPWLGGIGVHDADLDGVPDLWGVDGQGYLRYAHPAREDETPPSPSSTDTADTGDTGLP